MAFERREPIEFAVAVVYDVPEGVVVVEELEKPAPIYPKFPGGAGKKGETPRQAAVRELFEETGIIASEVELEEVYSEPRRGHHFHLFRRRPEFRNRPLPAEYSQRHIGNDGEMVGIVPFAQCFGENFLPKHRQMLEKVIPPAERPQV